MTSTAFPRTAASYSAMAVSVLAVIGRGQGRARSPATGMDGRCSSDHRVMDGGGPGLMYARVPGHELVGVILAGVDRVERSSELGRIDLGKEPKAAQVHAQNRDARRSRERERPQDRAVTTRRDHQVGSAREVFSRKLI